MDIKDGEISRKDNMQQMQERLVQGVDAKHMTMQMRKMLLEINVKHSIV